MLRRAVLAGLLAGLLAACGRSQGVPDEDLGDLVIAKKEQDGPIDVDKATHDPAELGRGLHRPFQATIAALGRHATTMTTSSVVAEGTTTVSELSDKSVLELGEGAAFHGVYENTGDLGRETIYVPGPAPTEGSAGSAAAADGPPGMLYLRPRYQKWHGRAPETLDEAETLRDGFVDGVAATWDLLAPGVELTDGGAATVAGRAGRKIVVKLSPTPQKPPAERLTQRKWREGRTVEAVSGELVIDADTGVLLAAKLAGTILFVRDGRRMTMKVTAESTVSAIGTAAAITAPVAEDVVATPERRREVDDRDALLQGLAPPTRRGGGGATVVPAPPAAPDKKAPDKPDDKPDKPDDKPADGSAAP